MSILRRSPHIGTAEITPESVYLDRRRFSVRRGFWGVARRASSRRSAEGERRLAAHAAVERGRVAPLYAGMDLVRNF